MTDLKAYSKANYFIQLSKDIEHCKPHDRIVVAAMTFDQNDPLINALLKNLALAAQRGIETILAVDAYCFLIGNRNIPGPLEFSRKINHVSSPQFQAKSRFLNNLRAQGVKVVITNPPPRRLSNPFAGRSHAKYAVINDTAYLGGCNLDSSTDYDLMVSCTDKRLADWLYNYALALIRNGGRNKLYRHDQVLDLGTHMKLLLDVGIPGQSEILQHAYYVIDHAKQNLMLTCMIFPDGSVMQHLIKAHERGVHIRLLCNHPAKLRFPSNLYHRFQMRHHQNLVPDSFYDHQLPRSGEFLHLKVLASENAAIVGSHNFVDIGVKLGTIEMALYTEESNSASVIRQAVEDMTL